MLTLFNHDSLALREGESPPRLLSAGFCALALIITRSLPTSLRAKALTTSQNEQTFGGLSPSRKAKDSKDACAQVAPSARSQRLGVAASARCQRLDRERFSVDARRERFSAPSRREHKPEEGSRSRSHYKPFPGSRPH